MSLLSALTASLTGLDAARRNVQLAAHNAANVHTEGYSRKQVDQTQIVVDGVGMGVDASTVERAADDFLTRELRTQKSALAGARIVADMQDRVQVNLFGPPGEDGHGVARKLATLAAAFESYANQPDKVATQTATLGAVRDFAAAVDAAGREIQQLRKEAETRIGELVDEVNGEIAALHELNLQVARNGPTPELLDQRDRLLESLAEKIEITVADLDRGTIAVYARGGTPLVEYGAKRLVYDTATAVAADTVFDAIEVYDLNDIDPDTGEPKAGASGIELVSGGSPATTAITTGRLAGLLELRDEILPELADQYDELAELARFTLNATHNTAWPSPPPGDLTGTRTGADTAYDAATRSGTAWAAVVDRDSGETVATIELDLSLGATALVSALDTALTGYGSASFDADGALVVTANSGYGIAFADGDGTITETDGDGRTRSYGFAHYFGLNDLLVRGQTRATELSLAPALATDASRLGHARLTVDTTSAPPLATLGGAGDNRGALALGTALETAHATLARGRLPARDVDLRTYAADIAALAARATTDAERDVASRAVLVEDLAARRSAVAGVSLDEELSRLTLYQQSYAASARILGVVDEMLEELMRTIG